MCVGGQFDRLCCECDNKSRPISVLRRIVGARSTVASGAAMIVKPKPDLAETGVVSSKIGDSGLMQQVRPAASVLVLIAVAWLLYTLANLPALAPSTDAGYYIGIVGASLMLLLMTYPLYKRVRAFRSIGTTRFWFRLHMVFGLLGPALIIVHSGLNMRSMNAAWAFWSMVVVAGSGIVGRFLYRRIHRGMHGELETTQTLAAAVAAASFNIDRALPDDVTVSREIGDFAAQCAKLAKVPPFAAIGAVFLPLWRWSLQWHVRRALKQATVPVDRRVQKTELLDRFLISNQRYAQFALFDRLFSLWHVAHVPFVVTLFLSTIAHIVAVHLY